MAMLGVNIVQENCVHQQVSLSVKGMNADLYRAALSGSFEVMNHIQNWKEQKTSTENNVLHVHVGKPIRKNPKDLTKAMVNKEFIDKVINNDEGFSLLWKVNSNGDTPLHVAARFGHVEAIQSFLDRASQESQDEITRMLKLTNKNKDTALHEAARAGHAAIVELLVKVDSTCQQHQPNEEGETPLYLAAERGSTNSVLSILNICRPLAPVYEYKGPCGLTHLHAAVQWGDPVMVLEILKHDRTLVRVQTDEGLTPIHCAAADTKRLDHLKILLQYDENESVRAIYFQDNAGRTALHLAMLQSNWDAIEELIGSSPDCIEMVDNNRQNVVHYAAKFTCLGVISRLLKLDYMDKLMNEKDMDGNTPLHLLASSIPSTRNKLHYCLTLLSRLAENYPFVDLRAFNKQNLTVGDIKASMESLVRRQTVLGHGYMVVPRGRRINTFERDFDIEKAIPPIGEMNVETLKRVAESRLVVAALIATVSFTAGFTLPGGFNQTTGEDMGMAVLKRKISFKVFLISDAIAFTSSILAIVLYFMLVSRTKVWAVQKMSVDAFLLNSISLGALMIAFLAGVSAVLSNSVGLIIAMCVISVAFFLYYYRLIRRSVVAAAWIHRSGHSI